MIPGDLAKQIWAERHQMAGEIAERHSLQISTVRVFLRQRGKALGLSPRRVKRKKATAGECKRGAGDRFLVLGKGTAARHGVQALKGD